MWTLDPVGSLSLSAILALLRWTSRNPKLWKRLIATDRVIESLQVGTFEKLRPRRSQVFLRLVTWVRSLKGHPQMEIDLKSLWSIGQLQRYNGFVESQDSMMSVCTCVSQHSTVSVSILLNSFQGSYGKCCTGKALLEAAGNGVSSIYIKKHQCTKVVLQTFGGEIN